MSEHNRGMADGIGLWPREGAGFGRFIDTKVIDGYRRHLRP